MLDPLVFRLGSPTTCPVNESGIAFSDPALTLSQRVNQVPRYRDSFFVLYGRAQARHLARPPKTLMIEIE